MKKKDRKLRDLHDILISDPNDGLRINRIKDAYRVTRHMTSINIFEANHIALEFGSGYHLVSINKKIHLINEENSQISKKKRLVK